VIPSPNAVNRWRHRHFVRVRDRRDLATQKRLGFDTFAQDWSRLMSGTGAPAQGTGRTVWILWLQGEQAAPPLVRRCIESWRERNPGWQIRVLDAGMAEDLTDLPGLPEGTSMNHRANLIRLRLLARYGGVWVDATALCRLPLDDWIDRAARTGFFAFARPQPIRSLANWFIAARPGHPLLEAWRVWSENYLMAGKVQSYFWSHHTFDWLLKADRRLRRSWAEVPRVSARGPHIVQRLLDGHIILPDPESADLLRQVPLFKLSWKKDYTPQDVEQVLRHYDAAEPGSHVGP